MKHDFPLATKWAVDLIAAVLPPSRVPQLTIMHLNPIAGLIYRAHLLEGESLNSLHVRVRATFKLLERGFDEDPGSMASAYDRAFSVLDTLQQRAASLAAAAWDAPKADPEQRFGSLLELFQFTYERYYPTLAGPVVVADALVRTKQSPAGLTDSEGRVKVSILTEIEAGQALKAGSLTEGLDNHLRNAKAHHHYDILSDNTIKLWDVRPGKGGYSWGPVTLSYWDLSRRVYALTGTSSVLMLGLAMFDIAYGSMMRQRGWSKLEPQRPRRDVAKAEMADAADLTGFEVQDVRIASEDALSVTLRVLDETSIDQLAEIRTSSGARYSKEIRTHHAPLRQQVIGFVQLAYGTHAAFESLRIHVVGRDGKEPLGDMEAGHVAREEILSGKKSIREVCALLTKDTLVDRTIPVIHSGIPRQVT